jgi:hypothetical protein
MGRRNRKLPHAVESPPCACTGPGWCERHNRTTTAYTFALCQQSPEYRDLLDRIVRDGPQGIKTPPLGQRVRRYAGAVARWIAAGRPTRSDEEVARIYEQICTPCRYFQVARSRCRICGCKLGGKPGALRNKIAMATETCPLEKWPGDRD